MIPVPTRPNATAPSSSPQPLTDFGGFPHAPPRRLATVSSRAEVVAAVRTADAQGLPLGFRGAGHSCHGQTECPDGLLIQNFVPDAQWESVDDEWIRVHTRSRWGALERELNAMGRSAPVMTDYMDLSVGGTLAVGGFGVDSLTHGAQVDHVREVEIVATDGCAHTIDRALDPDLFRFALAARGQLGFVESVVMRTVEYRANMLTQRFHHRSLEELVTVVEQFASADDDPPPGRFRSAIIYPDFTFSEFGEAHRTVAAARLLPRPDYLRRLGAPAHETLVRDSRNADHDEVEGWVNGNGACRRMWVDYLLPVDAARGFVCEIESMRRSGDFGDALKCIFLGIVAPPVGPAFAFDPRGCATGGRRVSVGLYGMVPKGDTATVDKVDLAYQRALARCLQLGGRPYLYGRVNLDESQLLACYGDAVEQLRLARRRFDRQDRICTGRFGA